MIHFRRISNSCKYLEMGRLGAELGIPILGDKRYGNVEDSEKLHLHSRSVEFYHPNGNKMFFEAELPKHMKEKWKKYDLPLEVNI